MSEEPIASTSHPRGLWYLSAIYAFFTFCFGLLLALLIFYMLDVLHLPKAYAYSVFAGFNAIIWAFPVLGGYLAGRIGYKNALLIGLVLCILGPAILVLYGETTLFLGLALYIIGYAFATPACFSLVGFLYSKQDGRREGAFTLFYLLFNFGFLVSVVLSGFVVRYLGYADAFFLATLASVAALVTFLASKNSIVPFKGRVISGHFSKKMTWSTVTMMIVLGTAACTLLLQHVKYSNTLLTVLLFGSMLTIFIMALRQKEKAARLKLFAYLILMVVSLSYWALYMLEPSLLAVFVKSGVDRHLAGLDIPAPTFYSLDAVFVIIFGFFLSWLWHYLAKHNKNVSLPAKFSVALFFAGGGYLIFMLGGLFSQGNAGHYINLWWIVLGYASMAIAELLIAPIGLSMAGRLAPKGQEGFSMGVWNLSTGFAATLSGFMANMVHVPNGGSPAVINPIYSRAFMHFGLIAIAAGCVALCITPWVRQLVNSVRNDVPASPQ